MSVYHMGVVAGKNGCGRRGGMVGQYCDEDARDCCVEGVGMTGGGYSSVWERGRGSRILPEHATFGATVSGAEWSDCSAGATSSAQEEILVV